MRTCNHHFRVRYAETDQMGVVHNSVYLIWFEMGRTEYCHTQGFPYSKIEEAGIILVVAEAKIRYKKPAYYDDVLVVKTTPGRISPKVLKFNYQIVRKSTDELVAEGETVHVAVGKDTGRPTRIPASIIEKLMA